MKNNPSQLVVNSGFVASDRNIVEHRYKNQIIHIQMSFMNEITPDRPTSRLIGRQTARRAIREKTQSSLSPD